MIKIERFVLGSVQTNSFLIYEEGGSEALVFDPADRGEWIYGKLKEKGLTLAAILLTHAHFDHILGCNELRKLSGAKVYACREEQPLCEDPQLNVSLMFGRPVTVTVDEYLADGAVLNLAGLELRLIATPGHTVGSCCYYLEKEKTLITGDTLFAGSVGRTDFPTGSGATLARSLKEKLMCLPEDTAVYPGHEGFTTIGEEKRYNPFCV